MCSGPLGGSQFKEPVAGGENDLDDGQEAPPDLRDCIKRLDRKRSGLTGATRRAS